MKSFLIIDTPKNCDDCPCADGELGLCQADEKQRNCDWYKVPLWCPLKPMPTKKKPLFDPNHCEIEEEIKIIHEIDGYNRCIDEILGETE